MDYNFERSWLFLATDNNGAGIERLQMDVSVNAQQDLTLVAMGKVVVVVVVIVVTVHSALQMVLSLFILLVLE